MLLATPLILLCVPVCTIFVVGLQALFLGLETRSAKARTATALTLAVLLAGTAAAALRKGVTDLGVWTACVCALTVIALLLAAMNAGFRQRLVHADLLAVMWKPLAALAVLMLTAEAYIGLVWTPPEKFMGDVYRIYYVHVPQVWMALLAMTLNFVCSLVYLLKKSFVADALAEASAEVSLYFGFVGITLGAIWGRPTWGVYWTWDPRLTSAAVMLIYLAAYLVLRRFIDNPDTRGTYSAALGVFGIVIPVTVYFSVKWMVSIHQVQSNPSTVDPTMAMSLRWSACAFLCLMMVFIYQRYRIAKVALSKEIAVPELLPAAPSKGAVA